MTDTLTKENLIRCLEQKQRYKGTTAFLQQVLKFKQQVFVPINAALMHVLLTNNSNYMAKLFALRFFKEILLTGNFTLIDFIDERIEEYVLNIAKYNKKSKEISRGANYFIEIQKFKKDAEIQKIGSSFVLLATEIITVIGQWYHEDQDKEETRFLEYYRDLVKNGVAIPNQNQFNFFKKQDADKFKKNYAKWVQFYSFQVQVQQEKDCKPNIKSFSLQNKFTSLKKMEISDKENIKIAIKESNQAQQNLNESNNKKIVKPIEINADSLRVTSSPNNVKVGGNAQNVGNGMNISPSFGTIDVVSINQNIQKQLNGSKLQIQRIRQQNRQMKDKYENELMKLKNQSAQMKQANLNLQKKCLSFQQQLNKSKNLIKMLQNQHQKLLKQKVQLQLQKQSLKNASPSIIKQMVKQTQCYNIVISPPNFDIDGLEDQNQFLKTAFQKLIESTSDSELRLKQENIRLINVLKEKESQIFMLRQGNNTSALEKQMIKTLIHQDSLIISDQIKVDKLVHLRNSLQQSRPKLQKKQSLSKKCSMSQFLRENSRIIIENNPPIIQTKSRSLKKTESTQKLKQFSNTTPSNNRATQYFSSNNKHAILNKTSQGYSRQNQQISNKVVTVLPYLEDYFPKINEETIRFKHHCLQIADFSRSFFQNDVIKVGLKAINSKKYIIGIQNRTNYQQKVKLISGHYSFCIVGQKCKKIQSLATVQFQLSAQNIDLNLRYPSISVVIGNHGISLTNSIGNDRTFNVPLPICLLNFFTFTSVLFSNDFPKNSKKVKYMSAATHLAANIASIRQCFPTFNFITEGKDVVYRGIVEFMGLQNCKIFLQLKECSRQISIATECQAEFGNSTNLAKVIHQVMMFLLQD